MASTSEGVLVAGGITPAQGEEGVPLVASRAVFVSREDQSVSALPNLPESMLTELAMGVSETLFAVGSQCESVEVFDYDTDCSDGAVAQLSSDKSRWVTLEGGADLLAGRQIGAVGVVSGHLALVLAGASDTAFVLYDPAAEAWSAVPGPSEEVTNSLLYCFGSDSVLAFRPSNLTVSSQSPNAQLSYDVWSFAEGRWGPSYDVDLGEEVPNLKGYAREFCGEQGLILRNGASTVGLVASGPEVVEAAVPDSEPFYAATQGTPKGVGVTTTGAVVAQTTESWLSEFDLVNPLPFQQPARTSQTSAWLDILVPIDNGQLTVVSVPVPS